MSSPLTTPTHSAANIAPSLKTLQTLILPPLPIHSDLCIRSKLQSGPLDLWKVKAAASAIVGLLAWRRRLDVALEDIVRDIDSQWDTASHQRSAAALLRPLQEGLVVDLPSDDELFARHIRPRPRSNISNILWILIITRTIRINRRVSKHIFRSIRIEAPMHTEEHS